MKLAIWQGPSPQGDDAAAFAALLRALRSAADAGASMLTAPEIFLPGYNQPDIAQKAQARGGAWHQTLAGLCRETGCGLTIGYAERDGEIVYNAAVAFDGLGREIAHYRKVQLYGPRENAIYAPGDSYAVFDLDGVKAALLICYDIEFAPHLRALALQGVTLILCPTANMEPWYHVSRLTVPTHAINHRLTIVYANFCGVEGDLTYCGTSVIVAPDGAILAQAGPGPALLVADTDRPLDPLMRQTQIEDFRPVR
jgi:5-aminopentanamidase